MITLLESFLPKWLIEVLVIGLLVVVAVLYLEHKGASAELGKLKISSAALVQKAQAQNVETAKQYQAASAANQEKVDEAQVHVASVQSQLDGSVRQYDTYRRAHRAVASPASSGVAAQSGECGVEDCGAVVERLAVRGNELAGSVGGLSAELQGCQRDRDALTGEPR